MDSIFLQVNCIFIYEDDVLVFSETEEQHYEDLTHVLGILQENNLKISSDKFQFFKKEIEFLGKVY